MIGMRDIKNIIFSKTDVINIIHNSLSLIDPSFINHGRHVAFILHEMFREERSLYRKCDWKNLFLVSSLHDIGMYKIR